ncbi:MAG: ABC transporter ATP-binding protein [Clostridia bacterium]|nr:ABC transporter ATP-binding protein [Clostridia bacterium]
MIRLQNVSFSYPSKQVLESCSAQFERGELCAIVGPNGSGKTTMLRLLSRLLLPENGRLYLNERAYEAFSRREFARAVALMPQKSTVPEMTVQEFVEHARYPYLSFAQKLSTDDRLHVDNALQYTHMQGLRDRYLRELSGGECQRAYLALLLAQTTDHVLLDEPTNHLDVSAQFEVMRILRAMRDENKCVVAVLHDLSLALRFCDRVIVMDKGRIVADARPDRIAESAVLREVFGVRCTMVKTESSYHYAFDPV